MESCATEIKTKLSAWPLDKRLLVSCFRTHRVQKIGHNFRKFPKRGDFNPYWAEKHVHEHSLLDTMRSPEFRLTEQICSWWPALLEVKTTGPLNYGHCEGIPFIFDIMWIRGISKTHTTLPLAAERLPTDITLLNEILLDVLEELGITRSDALADLMSRSRERIQRLRQTREATNKFYTMTNFQ